VEKKKAVVKVDAGDVALLVSLRLFATLSVGEREERGWEGKWGVPKQQKKPLEKRKSQYRV
jgi:hypothetical protein